MKNFLRPLKLACLAAASMLIVSCGGSADYRSILPADSFMTVSVNPASLMQKCEAGDLDQHPLYVRIKAELDKDQNLSAEEKEYLLALLKNPGESGIDVKKDFFFFAAMEGTVDAPVMRGGLLLPIGDKAKFDALLARINEKSGVAPETKGGVSVVDLGKEGDAGVLCAYNDIAFMVYFVQNGVDDLAGDVRKLFAQQSGESLMGDKAVAEQLARKNDINMVLSYGEILPMMNNPMLSSMPMMDALKGMTMVGSVNFEKGRIVTEAAVSYKDKESEAKMMDFYAYVKPQTGALLRYVPAASIGAMSLGLNGEKLYSMLSAMPGYGMLMANPMVKQVMEPFDGDFLLSFSGMGIDGKYPVASMLAQVKDPAVLQTIVTNMAGMPVRQTAEGEYTLNMGGVTILFGVKGDVLYCTTDAVVKMALDGGEIASMESMDKIFKGQSSTFYLDFEAERDDRPTARRQCHSAGGSGALRARHVRRHGSLWYDEGRHDDRKHGGQGAELVQDHLRQDRRADSSVRAGSEFVISVETEKSGRPRRTAAFPETDDVWSRLLCSRCCLTPLRAIRSRRNRTCGCMT